MTVVAQDPINQVPIKSNQTAIPWTWQLNQETDLTIFRLSIDTGLITTLVLDFDYTVNSADLGNKLGGTITFLSNQLPTVNGDIFTLQRNTALARKKDFATSGDFQAVTVNPQLDDPIFMAQDAARDAQNAVRKNPGVGDILDPLIPQMVDRRTIVFVDAGSGNFSMVMSDNDPDEAQNDAAASAAAALASEQAAEASETAAEQSADEAAQSALEAAQDVQGIQNFYQETRIAGPYIGDNFNTLNQTGSPTGIAFSTTGTKMFVLGTRFIYEYELTNPFNLHEGNVSFTGFTIDISGEIANPQDIKFNNDGTSIYVLDEDSPENIQQYSLSIGFDFSSTITTLLASTVSGSSSNPNGFVFNNDGTKVFVVDGVDKKVYEFDLSPAFTMGGGNLTTTASELDVSAEQTKPISILFNDDGTKLFVLDRSSSRQVNSYILGDAYDLGNAPVIFTGNEFATITIDDSAQGMAFSADGLKLFVSGQQGPSVYEYFFPGPFEIPHGATFTGNELNVQGQDNTPIDCIFDDTGNNFYMVGENTKTIYNYSLPTAYSLAGASTTPIGSFSPSESGNLINMIFSPDGLTMFILYADSGSIFRQYTLATAFDFNDTVTFTGDSFDFSTQDGGAFDIAFSADGLTLLMLGILTTTVYQYILGTAFDLGGTVTFTSNTFDPSSEVDDIDSMVLSPDGFTMMILGRAVDHSGSTIYQYDLDGAYSLASPVSFSGNFYGVSAQDNFMDGIAFNPEGTKLITVGRGNDRAYEYDLALGFSLNQFVYPVGDDENGLLLQVATTLGTVDIVLPNSVDLVSNFRVGVVKVSSDFNKVVVFKQGTDAINITESTIDIETQDNIVLFFLDILEPNWLADVGERSAALYNTNQLIDTGNLGPFDTGFNFPSVDDNIPKSISFNETGLRMFLLGDQFNDLRQYKMPVPFSLEFAAEALVHSFGLGFVITGPKGLAFSKSGLNFYVCGTGGTGAVSSPNVVVQFELTKPFDISTAGFFNFHNVNTQEPTPTAVRFNPSGRKMFVLGTTNGTLFQWTLSSPNQVQTAGSPDTSIDLTSEDSSPIGFDFSDDGLTLIMVGDTGNTAYEYVLDTPFDLTGSFTFTGKTFSLTGTSPRSITFNTDLRGVLEAGTRFFVADAGGIDIDQYDCPTPYDLEGSFNVTLEQNGFLFTVDSTVDILKLTLPDSSLLPGDFRFGVVKISADANSIDVFPAPNGTDTINAGSSISFDTQNKVVLISLDQDTGNWTADLPIAFRGALVYKSVNQGIPLGILTTLTWELEDYDIGGIHDIVTNNSRLTVPAGVTIVRFTTNIIWDILGTASTFIQVLLYKNGVNIRGGFFNVQEDSTTIGSTQGQNGSSAPIFVTGGDFFEVRVFQLSAGTLDVLDNSGFGTWFAMEIVK